MRPARGIGGIWAARSYLSVKRLCVRRGKAPWSRIMPKLLIFLGASLIALGLVWLAAQRLGLGRLPGDFVIEGERFKIYIPLASCLIVSVALTLVLRLFGR